MVYRIGDLAKDVGVRPDTIRYYEKLGLLNSPPRMRGGVRQYTAKDKDRLRFIRQAKNMGFTLKQVGELLKLRDGKVPLREDVRALAREKMVEIEARITELEHLHAQLRILISLCECASGEECPILSASEGG